PVAVRSPSAAAGPVRPVASATAAAVATVAAHALFTCPGTCPPGVSAESSDIRPAVVACAGAHPPADAVCRATILALKSRADLSGSRRSTATALLQLRYRTEGLAGSGGAAPAPCAVAVRRPGPGALSVPGATFDLVAPQWRGRPLSLAWEMVRCPSGRGRARYGWCRPRDRGSCPRCPSWSWPTAG